jgi:3-phosphoshikimate 1-carboxyvinyltransferase
MSGIAARYLVRPSTGIHGEAVIPGDKSISHRALMLGSLAEGDTEIHGFLESEDCLATLMALRQLGVRIQGPNDGHVIVHGHGAAHLRAPAGPLDMGNAGTAMRLFMGLLACQPFDSQLIGDASLSRRPMERVAVPLRLMGAHIMTHDGRPPVAIHGGHALCAIDYELPVPSAQVKSAILLAALRADGRTRVIEPAPSRDHTERMLATFGVEVLLHSGGTIALQGGQVLQATRLQVPGDFSSAAFFIVAGCLAAQQGLMLRGVGLNPTRTGLLKLLREMGADIRVHPCGTSASATHSATEPVADIEVYASALHGIKVAAADVPLAIDELPVFFIAAACASGETLVRGAFELRVKESDRLAAMATGLGRLGVEHELLTDGVWIRGACGFDGGVIDSHGDHRIAMAFAVAAVRARAPIEIQDVASVGTSFPNFVASARAIGLQIELCA